MALSRVKTWIAGEVLTASDLNGEFNNILDNLSFALSTQFADGSLTNLSIAFVNDTDTGGYRAGVNQFALVAGGATAFILTRAASAGTAFALFSRGISDSDRFYPALTFGGADDGLTAISAGTLDLIAGGRRAFQASSYVNATNFVRAVAAQAGQPPVLEAAGGDTNAALLLRGKGTGYVTASNFVLENFVATQSPTITGRMYWQTAEESIHISAGTLMTRVPALADIRSGDLLSVVTVSGATRYGTIHAATNGMVLEQASGLPEWVQRPPVEHCRLVRETNTKLNLASGFIPLKVGGVWIRRDVHTPVELLAPSVNSNTLYYIYASDNAGSTVLEASTTAHVAATGHNGVRVMSGDETRTLVGIAFAETAGAFLVSTATQFVHTWFNRPTRRCQAKFSTNRTTISGTAAEIDAEIRNRFVCWNDEVLTIGIMASVNNAANQAVTTRVGYDGSALDGTGLHSSAVASLTVGCGGTFSKAGLTEGTHYTTIMGLTSAGSTGTWLSDGSTDRYTSLSTTIS